MVDGERAARIDLTDVQSDESEEELEEFPDERLVQAMPFCTICFGTVRHNYKARGFGT